MNPDFHKSPKQDEADPRRDELLLQRHLDGELRPSERAELERALEKDASLRQLKRRGELQSEFFQADRERDLPPPLSLDFSDRVFTSLNDGAVLGEVSLDRERAKASGQDEPIALGRWILAAAVLLAVLLVGQFLTRPTLREEMRAGTREADKVLQELDRSSAERANRPAGIVPAGNEKK